MTATALELEVVGLTSSAATRTEKLSGGTWHLAQDLNHPRVKVIRRVGTRGLASAFNRGILESRGAVVGWMDADMCMPPAMLTLFIHSGWA